MPGVQSIPRRVFLYERTRSSRDQPRADTVIRNQSGVRCGACCALETLDPYYAAVEESFAAASFLTVRVV